MITKYAGKKYKLAVIYPLHFIIHISPFSLLLCLLFQYVPLVMTVCLTELESKWLDTEGLYRLAGPIGQVRVLAEELNKGRFDLLRDQNDPHVLTAILKKFLKELPNPIVPNGKEGIGYALIFVYNWRKLLTFLSLYNC